MRKTWIKILDHIVDILQDIPYTDELSKHLDRDIFKFVHGKHYAAFYKTATATDDEIKAAIDEALKLLQKIIDEKEGGEA